MTYQDKTREELINFLKKLQEQNNSLKASYKNDITKRKRTEEDLRAACLKAEESDRLKSTFLSTMSHELRTPLNAIIGFSDLIDENSPLNEIVEFNKIINKSGNHLLSIVEDIFDITLLEAGNIKIHKINVNLHSILTNIHKIIKVNQQLTNKDHLDLKMILFPENNDLIINTDPIKLNQILVNLLKNALKFTLEGHVHFGYKIEKDQTQTVIKFYVEDTGIGIPENKQELMFDIFRQIEDSANRKYHGTGIGLSIAKKLIGLLGGDIWLESVVGEGSVFYFSIPYIVHGIDDQADETELVEVMNIKQNRGRF